MLGMPSVQAANANVVRPGEPPGKLLTDAANVGVSRDPKQTVFGVDVSASAAPTQARTPPSAASHRTMLGIVPVPVQKPSAGEPESRHSAVGPAPIAGASDARPSAAPPAQRGRERRREDGPPLSFTPPPSSQERGASLPSALPTRRGVWLAVGALAMGAIFLLVVAVLLFTGGGYDVSVRVVQAESDSIQGGDALQIEIPAAKPGAKVRFAGEERPLVAGRALFPLRADGLSLGDNPLTLAVVEPDGDVETLTVHLAVDYRVRTDLSGLRERSPGIDVVVDAQKGAKVTLDGAQLALDAHGRGKKRYPIPPQAESVFTVRVPYRIELPGGQGTEGEVNLTLPVTSAQIDRPGPDVITDQALLEVAGAAEPSAEVTVEGTPVPLHQGRFLYRANLPQPGEYKLQVVARAAGKAPRVIEIRVRRVSDMTLAAASFKYDATLTYARIAQNPAIYRGQSVAFDGRVYNVEVQGGRSILQMLALDCPRGARCPLWVEYPQATDATVDSRVRVLGTVIGEQQFRSKQGQVQTVPSVQAQYVLPLAR